MEILITHLTRMRDDRICLAGLDEDGRHVRPLGRGGQPFVRGDALADWQLGNVVRLGNASPPGQGEFPEDTLVDIGASTAVRRATDDEIRDRLLAVAVDSLGEAFPGLELRGHNRWVVPVGRVVRSLAVLRAPTWHAIPEPQHDKAVLGYHDRGLPAVRMPILDLRLFPDGPSLDFQRLQGMTGFLDLKTPAIVSVGLGRAWAPDDSPPVHWTQANTLFSGRSDRLLYGGTTAPHLLPPGVVRS